MKHAIATSIIPLVLVAAPALSAAETSATCDERFQSVSASWAEMKKTMTETEEVSVATSDGETEVEAKDAKPTENWFGKPPNVETVDGYMEEAERAMEAGDTEGCMAQLENAQAAFEPGKTATTEN